jgi:NADP-dependent 3-hydroxy acid dehydrogenase YdfG
MKLSNKIAIVTGASKGLGAAIAKALVGEGATVYGIARNRTALEALQHSLKSGFIAVSLDLSNLEAVQNWLAEEFYDGLLPDILINNAGVGSFGKIDEMPAGEWHAMVNTNLNGMYHITAEVVKLMKRKTRSSHIVNIGSILGTTTRAEGAAYSATKYAVNGFSESLFKELRQFNIKVTCLNPGSIDTEFFKSSGIEPHGNMLQPDEVAASVMHVLKTPENMLISEMTIRPLHPKAPE